MCANHLGVLCRHCFDGILVVLPETEKVLVRIERLPTVTNVGLPIVVR